jgi:hypothetical protein
MHPLEQRAAPAMMAGKPSRHSGGRLVADARSAEALIAIFGGDTLNGLVVPVHRLLAPALPITPAPSSRAPRAS